MRDRWSRSPWALILCAAGCAGRPEARAPEVRPESQPDDAGVREEGSGASVEPAVEHPAPELAPAHAATTGGGTWLVRWRPAPGPIRENEPFELRVEVERATDESPFPDEGRLDVEAWMAAHRHGMIRQPRTERLGDGHYLVRGLLLHMGGEWQLRFNLACGGKFEQAAFDLALLPEETARSLEGFDALEVARVLALSPLPPPPDDPTNAHDTDEAAAHLGRWLFFDPRLSRSGAVSCASCHVPELDWADGKPLSDAGTPLERHAPSLWNVAYGRWFFWDGRADSLWSQALQPLEDPREHGGDRVSLYRLVASDADLRRVYEEAFGPLPEDKRVARLPPRARPMPDSPEDPLAVAWSALAPADRAAVERVFSDLGKALAAFERQLVSRAAPFDRFVAALEEGDAAGVEAYPAAARRGLRLFVGEAKCHFCHSGPNFSDREFHNNRVPVRDGLPVDLGRFRGRKAVLDDPFNGLGAFADGADADTRAKLEHTPLSGHVWGEFKTPTLRNAARTPPYMHQGQLATLAEVIEFYSEHVPPPHPDEGEKILGALFLDAGQKSDLIAFLESLVDTEIAVELRGPPAKPYRER